MRPPPEPDARESLRADCSRCTGLCCMVPAFGVSADFPIDKPAGTACRNLLEHRCQIHSRLREEGFVGCVTFDCFGAGQQVTQVTVEGRDWRGDPLTAIQVRQAFPVMRRLHELLWYLAEARLLVEDAVLSSSLLEAVRLTTELAGLGAEELAVLDLDTHLASVNPLLVESSARARAGRGPGAELRGAELIGVDLRRRRLRAASLRGALLVGADLRGVDLGHADLTGADLRGADLRSADLSAALFVTAPQLASARGDGATLVPAHLSRPAHWPARS